VSLPGDENPNPQWQRREDEPKPQWTSGNPLGEQADEPPAWQQQPPQSEWQRQPPPQWQQPQQPAQPHPGWVPPPRTPGQAYASLILGIVGLVVCPLLPSIAALITGYGAKNEIDRAGGQLGGRGIALTGIILGWIAVGFWALILLIIVVGAAA
jgi:hypothetical protein